LSLKSDNKILCKKRSKWFLTKGEKNPKLPDTKGKKDIGPIDIKISEAHTDRPGIFIKQTYLVLNLFSLTGLQVSLKLG